MRHPTPRLGSSAFTRLMQADRELALRKVRIYDLMLVHFQQHGMTEVSDAAMNAHSMESPN